MTTTIDGFTTDWPVETLGDICERAGGLVQTGPFGSQLHASDYAHFGVPVVMPINLGENVVIEGGIKRTTTETAQRLARHRLTVGDVVMSRRGDLERRALISSHEEGWLCGTGCLLVRLGKSDLAARFLSYYLAHPSVRDWINAHAVGTTMPNLSAGIVSRLPLVRPPRAVQDAVVGVLGSLDDRILLNRRMNQTLEAMARAVFRSWFVDFDPVVAKAEGRQPFAMDAEAAALFPSRFVESELGPIPDGWSVGRLADICATQYGYTASATQDPAGPHFLRVTDINKRPWIEWHSVPYCVAAEDVRRSYGLHPGDIVVSRMADPGKAAIVDEQVDAVFASYLVRLSTTPDLAHYLFYFLTSEQYLEYVEGARSGTVQQNMNARIITAAPMSIPPRAVARAFSDITTPLRKKIMANVKEDHTLVELRDTLLPKLLSGEIRIRDAEKKAEAAL